MQELTELTEARNLMKEAMEWSVMKWLTEKKRVRKTADAANAMLDHVEAELHNAWPRELQVAYDGKNGQSSSPEIQRRARELRESHDAAIQGRMDAEDTFERAEKRLSVSLAREGCQKALAGWDHHENAIRKSEVAAAAKK
ncbi:MAG TPA: hypothetical protein VF786_03210 [Terriglobales bacterium]